MVVFRTRNLQHIRQRLHDDNRIIMTNSDKLLLEMQHAQPSERKHSTDSVPVVSSFTGETHVSSPCSREAHGITGNIVVQCNQVLMLMLADSDIDKAAPVNKDIAQRMHS